MTFSEGFPSNMVLLDCETTGGNPLHDRMTELALIFVENGEITGRWQQLFNPAQRIPPWISELTGITDSMVVGQPSFAELADTIQDLLADKVLVAHHARFDYGFLRAEFQRAGITFLGKTLCSVKLSRRFYPTARRHGIDAIVARLGLHIENRHRAMDDADVIGHLFTQISADYPATEIEQACKALMQQTRLPSQLDPAEIDKLPESPGIYRFYDENGALLYIGKSINIKQRVLSHFAANKSARSNEMQQQLSNIEFTETPSDFGAQLLENQLIKSETPLYNRRQTKAKRLFQLALSTDKQGYQRVQIEMADLSQPPEFTNRFGLFRSQRQAQQKLLQLVSDHQLCQQLTGLEPAKKGSCFGFQLKKCKGACAGLEPAAIYNLRLQTALSGLKNQVWPWSGPILVTETPLDGNADNAHYHLIDQWLYLGRVNDADSARQRLSKINNAPQYFDLDAYKIQLRFLLKLKPKQLTIQSIPQFAEEWS